MYLSLGLVRYIFLFRCINLLQQVWGWTQSIFKSMWCGWSSSLWKCSLTSSSLSSMLSLSSGNCMGIFYFVLNYANFFQNPQSSEGKTKYDSGNVSWSQWSHSWPAEKGQKHGHSPDLYCGHVHSLPESQNHSWHLWSFLLWPYKWHFSLPVSIFFGNPHLSLTFDVGCQFSLQLSDLHA